MFVSFTFIPPTLDERKTLTKISTCKTSHNHSSKLAHTSDNKETGRKPSLKRQTTGYIEKSCLHPGILEGLVGRLGLVPPGVTDPPTSIRAGVSCHWAATLREAVRRTEGRDIDLKQVMSTVVPYGLHLDYDLDFQTQRVDDVAPTLTSPLLSGLVGYIRQLDRPVIPGELASFRVDEDLWDSGRAPPKLDVPSPSPDNGVASKI